LTLYKKCRIKKIMMGKNRKLYIWTLTIIKIYISYKYSLNPMNSLIFPFFVFSFRNIKLFLGIDLFYKQEKLWWLASIIRLRNSRLGTHALFVTSYDVYPWRYHGNNRSFVRFVYPILVNRDMRRTGLERAWFL